MIRGLNFYWPSLKKPPVLRAISATILGALLLRTLTAKCKAQTPAVTEDQASSWSPRSGDQGTSSPVTTNVAPNSGEQEWNWHFQNTDIVQGDLSFPAKYSGPASLNSDGEVQETVTADLLTGIRLWPGAEAHMDLLMWQGYGLSQTHGVEAFPNGDAYKAGTEIPYFNFSR